jgi:hypothetical protein
MLKIILFRNRWYPTRILYYHRLCYSSVVVANIGYWVLDAAGGGVVAGDGFVAGGGALPAGAVVVDDAAPVDVVAVVAAAVGRVQSEGHHRYLWS